MEFPCFSHSSELSKAGGWMDGREGLQGSVEYTNIPKLISEENLVQQPEPDFSQFGTVQVNCAGPESKRTCNGNGHV